MSIIDKIFPTQGAAQLALDFGAEKVTLLSEDASTPQGWSALAEASLTDDDFADQVEALRSAAAKVSPDCAVDLWLPADQILNSHLNLAESKPWSRVAAAKAAIAERTPLSANEITLDLAPGPEGLWIACATETAVVDEAQSYARKWGFAPAMTTTRHADAAFSKPPNLGGGAGPNRGAIAGGALVAAAVVATVAYIAWPTAPAEPNFSPAHIALAPAASLQSPAPAQAAPATAPQASSSDVIVLRSAPTAPNPSLLFDATASDEAYDFSASLDLITPSFAAPGPTEFQSPSGVKTPPLLVTVAYAPPLTAFDAPIIDTAVLEPFDDEPQVDPSEPGVLAALAPREAQPTAPTTLQSFEVASLGDGPLALRTEDLLVEELAEDTSEETPPSDAGAADEPAAAPTPEVPTVNIERDPREPVQEAAKEDDTPGPGAVAQAPKPAKRPDSLDMTPGVGAVAAAPQAKSRPKSIKPKPLAVARNTSSAKTVRAPSRGRPTGTGLANAATLKGALVLNQTSLLGVFGTSKNRRALLRMSDGQMRRVSQGEVIDGWVISRIQATSMRMTRGAEVLNLTLIR